MFILLLILVCVPFLPFGRNVANKMCDTKLVSAMFFKVFTRKDLVVSAGLFNKRYDRIYEVFIFNIDVASRRHEWRMFLE
jgi:hypothetical protein